MAIRGIKLDTAHDLALDSGGRFVAIEGDAATGQEIDTRLRFFKGEGFTDTREGVPWFQEILRKGADLARVRRILRQVIASVPAVVDVPKLEITVNGATREGLITWTARTTTGRVVSSAEFAPLVV